MKSLIVRGVAIALAGWTLAGDGRAQDAPYGVPMPYAFGSPAPYGAPALYGTYPQSAPMPYGNASRVAAPQSSDGPILGPGYATAPAYGPAAVAPASGYGPGLSPLSPAPNLQGVGPTLADRSVLGNGQGQASPAWMTGTRLQPELVPPAAQAQPLYAPPPVAGEHSPYEDPQWRASPWSDGAMANACGVPACRPCSNWFGGVSGLLMTRDDENDVWLSYDTNDIQNRVLTSRDADMDWAGGFEARLGRYFNCGNNAIEAVYWGLFPNVRCANAYSTDVAGDLDTVLHFDDIWYDPGGVDPPVSDAYFDAERHLLRRSYQFHNVETNLWGGALQPTCVCGPRLSWLAGVRYFRFDEGFQYSTDPDDMGLNGDPEEVNYTINVVNNLIGFQLGGRLDYDLWECMGLYATTKVGVFGNHIRHFSRMCGSNGAAYIVDPGGPFDGSNVCVASQKDDVAMIGELNLGGNYRMSRCWSVNAGYRAVALTGLALSTNQIPVDYIANLDSLRAVDSNGSMILHGFYGGIQYNW
ncbi:MAG: hypothetical protein FJ297_03385 [Planctomycetes bacterium]|nr:hypothetical protein [Planctomycetota bacterium]